MKKEQNNKVILYNTEDGKTDLSHKDPRDILKEIGEKEKVILTILSKIKEAL